MPFSEREYVECIVRFTPLKVTGFKSALHLFSWPLQLSAREQILATCIGGEGIPLIPLQNKILNTLATSKQSVENPTYLAQMQLFSCFLVPIFPRYTSGFPSPTFTIFKDRF